MTNAFTFRCICYQCKVIFDGISNVRVSDKYDTWIRGFLCPTCGEHQSLDRYNDLMGMKY